MAYLQEIIIYANADTAGNISDARVHLKANHNNDTYTFDTGSANIGFNPGSSDDTEIESVLEMYFPPSAPGVYAFDCMASSAFEDLPFTVEITVVDGTLPPPTPTDPSTYPKYVVEYPNFESDEFRLEIWQKGFTGTEPTFVRGNANHHYTDRKDLTQAIIASTLDITLEADENLTLSDLYTEDERDYSVKFFRNSQLIFQGFLKPDGIWEDFTSDKWELTLDAIDGLSMLKNLSFVKDNAAFFYGKISQYDCVYFALKRIGYTLPINISADLPVYTGFTDTETILRSVMINTERFYQEEGKVMDCESVLSSVLDIYNATIIQMHGEWWIYRTVDVKNSMPFIKYEGMAPGVAFTWSPLKTLGSHIDEYTTLHCGANQRKSVDASLQAFRVNYKYGTAKSIITNSELKLGYGLSSDGWTIQSHGGKIQRSPTGYGIRAVTALVAGEEIIRTNQTIPVFIDDKIDVVTRYIKANLSLYPHRIQYKIETNSYILSPTGWVNKVANPGARVEFLFVRGDMWVTHTINLPPILEDGSLNITLYGYVQPLFYIESIDVIPAASNIKGEFHTGERKTRKSSVSKPDRVVYNGDSESNLFTGTLYKATSDPTTTWHRIGVTEEKPLLQLLVEDTLRLRPRPMIFFEGDINGYYPFLTMFTINNVPGKYQVGKYSYITTSAVNKSNLREFETDEMDDYNYRLELDYGNATKVGISVT